MMENEQKKTDRTSRVAKALEESRNYRALDADLWFRQSSSSELDRSDSLSIIESFNEIQDQRLAQIHYTFACKAYEVCLELCMIQLEGEDKSSRKAPLLETALCKSNPSLGITAASLMLRMGDNEGILCRALLATVPAIIHCGDFRICKIISQAISQASEPNQIAQKFVKRLIEEKMTPDLAVIRLRVACSYVPPQPVSWNCIVGALISTKVV
ncbi:hypothetical protein CROQUDRAFT_109170 [Cronartium quercuum f. sp. fusiforme G11]|uniref:Uncharacterized protein n=1 Tax=Cronartium quercuum f. sp. fusiforme G11 TaxID=708437 RepID=A0A9P6T8T9_9BASI|nr:hypothetical protein CROQUDRAFT_109170 [Cronartium quercuum f. sp. fusiforme G11]